MSEKSPYSIHALELGPMENFIYLIHDHATDTAAVVDPAWDVPEINALAEHLGVRITDILLTHSHHDHINGIGEVMERHDARIHLLKPEAQFWGQQLTRPALHHGGDRILVGETGIEILHTPGHTPGSACYRINGDLITGDTLFVFGCGRCDLRGGDPEQMFQTLKRIRDELPGDIVVHPGHNYAEKPTSTLEEQAQGNPFMCFTEVDRFIRYRMQEHDRIRHTPYGPVPCRHGHEHN
jgi:hydroxyacylglutathione hydrolase